jgi:integrase
MAQQKFNYRFTLKPNGKVFLRVRWSANKEETSISLCVYADPAKWDSVRQCAKGQTIHEVFGKVYTARTINREIDKAIDVLTTFFALCDAQGICPSRAQVKEELAAHLVPKIDKVENATRPEAVEEDLPSLDELYDRFIEEQRKERNWCPQTHYKYQQIFRLIKAFKNDVKLTDIDKNFCRDLKCWLVEQGYKNSTTTKYFRNLKAMLGWMTNQGYPVHQDCFKFKSNLLVPLKAVTFLKYEEVLQFENFKFPKNREYLAKARDLFCFMCYTSLRYSDLRDLKKASISDNCIDTYAKKTKGRLRIPLVSHAIRILEKYINKTHGEYVFPVPTNQKMNVFLKEAAEMAGLDREIVESTFCGSERIDVVHKLYETISCHDARRTFVCISLSLGIPQSVIMTITGHSDYAAMKPYIAISNETSKHELVKWEIGSIKSELTKLIDQMDQPRLEKLVSKARALLRS